MLSYKKQKKISSRPLGGFYIKKIKVVILLRYFKEILGFIGTLTLAYVSWSLVVKSFVSPLIIFTFILMESLIIWLIANVISLIENQNNSQKKLEKLGDAIRATKASRDLAQNERDKLERMYSELQNIVYSSILQSQEAKGVENEKNGNIQNSSNNKSINIHN